MIELAKDFEYEYIIYLDWYDGLVEGAIKTTTHGWQYLELIWAGRELDRRIFRTKSIEPELVEAFLQDGADDFRKFEKGVTAVVVSDSFAELIGRFISRAKEIQTEESGWLVGTSALEKGDWFEPDGRLRLEGKLLRDDSRVYGKYIEWAPGES